MSTTGYGSWSPIAGQSKTIWQFGSEDQPVDSKKNVPASSAVMVFLKMKNLRRGVVRFSHLSAFADKIATLANVEGACASLPGKEGTI